MSKQSDRKEIDEIRMQDILEDTIEYYSDDPTDRRAALDGDCVYTDADGRHCAIGRYMKPEFQTTEFYANSGISVNSMSARIDVYLVSKVLGLSENFWQALQELHDNDSNWGEDTGLSAHGKYMYNSLKNNIDAGGYS